MSLLHLFDSKEKKERLSHMKYVLMMAFADGRLEDSEVALLSVIAERIGLEPKEFQRLIEKPDSVKLRVPKHRVARLEILCDIAVVMMVDNDIDQKEMQLLLSACKMLGFSEDVALEIVQNIIEAAKKQMPSEETARDLDCQLGRFPSFSV